MDDRPHRTAEFLEVPENVVVAPIEALKALAAMAPKPETPAPATKTTYQSKGNRTEFDLERWMAEHGIEVTKKEPYQGGNKYILRSCPFDSNHNGTSAALFKMAGGPIVYKCQHAHCVDNDWQKLREMLEPEYAENKRKYEQHEYRQPSSDNGHGNPIDIGEIPSEYSLEHLTTDMGNSERFVRQHGANVKYNTKRKMYLLWQRTHHEWDDSVKILEKAQQTARSIYAEAAEQEDKKIQEILATWAKSSHSTMRLSAMLTQAKAHLTVELSELDRDGLLYNCQNGTIDLRTGKLRPHRKEDMITVCVPITFDPTAKCPTWQSFLQFITCNDTELETYLQKAVGYTLTGENKEQIFFDCYGEQGNNGKTTFLTVVRSLLGDYGTSVPIDLFLHNTKSNAAQGHTESLANIQGKRFVIPSELVRHARLAMALLKTVTGNDTIKASRKAEHEVEFVSICKIWLYGNYKPIVHEMGNSFWRRLKLIPFNAMVPDDQINKDLPAALQKELPGILNWAIAGCLAWQKEGFNESKAVNDATDKYRAESDELAQFIKDACELGTDNFTAKKVMKYAYAQWCEDAGQNQMHTSDFIRLLLEKGVTDGKQGNERGWKGIKITYAARPPEDKKPEEEQAPPEGENNEPSF